LTQSKQTITKLTDLDPNDEEFRKKLRTAVEQRLYKLEHKQIVAFAIRCAFRTAWMLPEWKIRDATEVDHYFYYYLRANTAALAVYHKWDRLEYRQLARIAAVEAAAAATYANAHAAAATYTTVANAATFAADATTSILKTEGIKEFLYTIESDLTALQQEKEIMDMPLWQGQGMGTLKMEGMDQLWLDHLFNPAAEGNLLLEKSHRFTDAFLKLEEEVFATKSAQAMADAIKEIMRGDVDLYNEARLVLLGNGGAGKTSLVRLLNNEKLNVSEKPTPRVSVSNLIVSRFSKKILSQGNKSTDNVLVNTWDFGGQVIMHSTHSFFISKKSCYIIVCNQRANEQPDDWLDMIKERIYDKTGTSATSTEKQTVLIVYSHCDDNNHSNNVPWRRDNAIKRKYGALLELQFFNINMDPSRDKGRLLRGIRFKQLQRRIIKQALIEGDKTVGKSISNIKQYIQQQEKKGHPYVSYKQLKKIIKNTQQIKERLTKIGINNRLQIANNYGYIFPESSMYDLNTIDDDFIFVNHSHWLTYGIYQLINSKKAQETHGIINHKQFKVALKRDEQQYIKNNGEVVSGKPEIGDWEGIKYDQGGIDVLKRIIINYRWGFIYHQRGGEMLLPLATCIDEPEGLEKHFPQNNADVHYIELVLANKPKDFFFRLATYLEPYLNSEKHLWRTGAIIQFRNNEENKAILEMPDNTLKLTIFGKDREDFLELILINIDETLKYYKNIRIQVFERMDISEADKPAKYEMISSGLIEGLLSNKDLVQKIRDKLLKRSTHTMNTININNSNIGNIGDQTGEGAIGLQINHINEISHKFISELSKAKDIANTEELQQIEAISQEISNAIDEPDELKKQGRFQKVVKNLEKFNTMVQASDALTKFVPSIDAIITGISRAIGM
jgi:GTPase SAR1 family protein